MGELAEGGWVGEEVEVGWGVRVWAGFGPSGVGGVAVRRGSVGGGWGRGSPRGWWIASGWLGWAGVPQLN